MNLIHTLGPPSGAAGTRSAARIPISWTPDPSAKQYPVQLSNSDGFGSTTTDDTSWAPDLDSDTLKKGGTFYWQVAAVDQGGNHGSGARGSFRVPIALQVTPRGNLQHRRTDTLGLRVTSVAGTPVKGARLTVTGLGIRRASKLSNRAGRAAFRVHPKRRGNLIVVVTRKGYQTLRLKVPVF